MFYTTGKMIKIHLGSCYFQTCWEIADCVLNALFEIEFRNMDIINHYLYVQIHQKVWLHSFWSLIIFLMLIYLTFATEPLI